MTNIFEEAEQKYGIDEFYACVSGGKDSISAADVTDKAGELTGIIFIDTTIGIPDTKNFVQDYCKERGWKLNIITPKTDYKEFIMRFGFPTVRFHNIVMGYLKYVPLRKFVIDKKPTKIGLISGVRKFESQRRSNIMKPIHKDGSMIFIAPIFNWTTEQVWKYIKENNLPVSPVYKTLHLSGDCLCGAFADAKEAILIRIFYPEIAETISELEKICPKKQNKWGNSGMCGTKNQKTVENFICADCELR